MFSTFRHYRDRASIVLLLALFAILPVMAVFGHRGLAPWLLLAALPAFFRGNFWQSAFGQLFDSPDLKRPLFAAFVAIVLFSVWVSVTEFWSPAHRAAHFLYILGPVLVGGSVAWFAITLPPLWAYRLSTAFALAVIVGIAVLIIEGLTGGFLRSILPPDDPTANNKRDMLALGHGVTALAPALFPAGAIAAMRLGKRAGAAVAALGLAAALANVVGANVGAVSAGVIAGLFALCRPQSAPLVIAGAMILVLLASPLLVLVPVDALISEARLPGPWLHRLAIWQTAASGAIDALPFGAGAEYARVWRESAGAIDIPGMAAPVQLVPTHPHQVFLEIWLELGLPGVLLLSAAIWQSARALQAATLPTVVLVGLAGAGAAITASFLVEGSLWQVWRLAALALAAMGVALSYSLYRARGRR